MGLDDFMDGFEEPEPSESQDTESSTSHKEDYTYSGNKELLDVDVEQVENVLGQTGLSFNARDIRIQGETRSVMSQKDSYIIVVSHPKNKPDRDCIKVHVLESKSLYDVIHPYEVYLIDGWKEELLEAIDAIKENHDELMYCPRCGSVMIIRKTNSTNELIRGCSDYPNCKYSEDE